jgi:hypothetical protein
MDGSQPLIMVAILSRKWPFHKVKQANGIEILSVPSLNTKTNSHRLQQRAKKNFYVKDTKACERCWWINDLNLSCALSDEKQDWKGFSSQRLCYEWLKTQRHEIKTVWRFCDLLKSCLCKLRSFLARTTDAQRGNFLHCTAENSIPIPNF